MDMSSSENQANTGKAVPVEEAKPIEPSVTQVRLHQETLDSNKEANKGFNGTNPIAQGRLHQEALDSNKEANKGFNGTNPITQGRLHQEALDSNKEANKGFNETNPVTRARLHQEALDSNKEANKGFNGTNPITQARLHEEALDSNRKANEGFEKIADGGVEIEIVTPSEITKQMGVTNNILNQVIILQQKDPTNPEITTMLNSINTLLVNMNNNSENPEPPLITPGTPEGGEPTPEEEARDRVTKKAKLIAGVIGGVAGTTTAIVGGPAVAGVASLITTGLLVGSAGVRWVGGRRITKLTELRDAEPNPVKREQYSKRIKDWEKARIITRHATNALKGYAIGLAAGSLFTKVFMGGQGIIERKAAEALANKSATATQGVAQNDLGQAPGASPTNNPYNTPVPNEVATGINPSETGLIQNGRVNLPGSAWNGNLAGSPGEGVSDLLSSSFAGGQTNMAAFQLNSDLAQAGLKLSDVTGKMGTGGVHQLLNGYFNAIRSGVANPTLETILNSTNVQGASEVLSMIK